MLQVMNSPFNEEQVELLNKVLPNMTAAQQMWLSGYFSALQIKEHPAPANNVAVLESPTTEQTIMTKEVTILYGSQTGTGQELANTLADKLLAENFKVTNSSMHDFKPRALAKVEILLIIVSTHGEGDPPDTAIQFHEYLHGKRAPKLGNLQFSVLSLGDSSYEYFCQTGKDFDKRLLELDAKQLVPRVDCDLDFDEQAEAWFTDVLTALGEQQPKTQPATGQSGPSPSAHLEKVEYTRRNPFQAEILENINLNGRGSNKETRHVELLIEGSNLTFEPGDSLGIYPKNDPKLVDTLIAEMDWNADQSITINSKGDIRSIREALISNFEITVLTKPLLKKAATLSGNINLKELVMDNVSLDEYTHGRDLLDLAKDFAPWEADAQTFINMLRKIPARLYSIASSLKANPDEVHLTIGTVQYESQGRSRMGVCSGECAHRLEIGDTLPIYVQHNDRFKLPQNPNTPIIMIGPGTGIAPFRSFMEDREENAATGKSWLFFGDQHYVTDFLYQVEWQRWLKDGVLTKMDVAFSRDFEEKVYVQHKMLEHSREIYHWLEEGAVVYVCGDEKHMASDVHATLLQILERESGLDAEGATNYLAEMQQQNRYQRDVY